MKIHLHCNLPYSPLQSNAALAYLKGFLSNEKNSDIQNIYWNILPPQLFDQYNTIVNQIKKQFKINGEEVIASYFARELFHQQQKTLPSTMLSILFDSPFFLSNHPTQLLDRIKSYISQSISTNELYDVDLAGFTLKTNQWILNHFVFEELKKHNPDLFTLLGGIRSLPQAEAYMRVYKNADAAIWGEGEIPFREFLKVYDDPSQYDKVPNLVYWKKNNLVSTKALQPEDLQEINSHPFADHDDFFSMHQQISTPRVLEQLIIPIGGIRSCTWNRCKFCIDAHDVCIYRERTPEHIVDEIEYQTKKYQTDRIEFMDDNIGRKQRSSFDHLLDLLIQSVNRRKKPYSIYADISPIRLTRLTIQKMKQICFDTIQFGFEAMTDGILRKMNKEHGFAYNIQGIKLSYEQELTIQGLNILRGIPHETENDVLESIQNLRFLRFFLHKYPLQMSKLYLEKDAAFYQELPPKELENIWNNTFEWLNIKDIKTFTSQDKFQFYGMESKYLEHETLWNMFNKFYEEYKKTTFKYHWIIYSDGSSTLDETTGEITIKFKFTADETKLLTFCDTVQSYASVKKHFPKLSNKQLHNMMRPLKKMGLLYYNDDFNHFIITPLSKKSAKNLLQ